MLPCCRWLDLRRRATSAYSADVQCGCTRSLEGGSAKRSLLTVLEEAPFALLSREFRQTGKRTGSSFNESR